MKTLLTAIVLLIGLTSKEQQIPNEILNLRDGINVWLPKRNASILPASKDTLFLIDTSIHFVKIQGQTFVIYKNPNGEISFETAYRPGELMEKWRHLHDSIPNSKGISVQSNNQTGGTTSAIIINNK